MAPSRAAISGPVWGSWGGCWRLAHQATPASATTETRIPSAGRDERRRRCAGGAAGGGVGAARPGSEVGVSVDIGPTQDGSATGEPGSNRVRAPTASLDGP